MEEWQYLFFLATFFLMASQATSDNLRIVRDYRLMSKKAHSAVGLSEESTEALEGFFLWCSRVHLLVMYMVGSHLLYWVINPGISETIIVFFELLFMMLIHHPQRRFAEKVLSRFFNGDVEDLNKLFRAVNH